MGIRNGIDVDIWDPENDELLPVPYNADSVVRAHACSRQPVRPSNRFFLRRNIYFEPTLP